VFDLMFDFKLTKMFLLNTVLELFCNRLTFLYAFINEPGKDIHTLRRGSLFKLNCAAAVNEISNDSILEGTNVQNKQGNTVISR